MAGDFFRPGRFVNKVVVLGGNSGIGRASALAFGRRRLVVTGRSRRRWRCSASAAAARSDIGDLAAGEGGLFYRFFASDAL